MISQIFTLSAKAKIKGVCEFLEMFFDYDKKIVVFGHHRFMLDAIEAFLKKKKKGYMRIDGNVPPKERENRV